MPNKKRHLCLDIPSQGSQFALPDSSYVPRHPCSHGGRSPGQKMLVGPVYITGFPRPGQELASPQPDANQRHERNGCHTSLQHQGTMSSDSVKISTWSVVQNYRLQLEVIFHNKSSKWVFLDTIFIPRSLWRSFTLSLKKITLNSTKI